MSTPAEEQLTRAAWLKIFVDDTLPGATTEIVREEWVAVDWKTIYASVYPREDDSVVLNGGYMQPRPERDFLGLRLCPDIRPKEEFFEIISGPAAAVERLAVLMRTCRWSFARIQPEPTCDELGQPPPYEIDLALRTGRRLPNVMDLLELPTLPAIAIAARSVDRGAQKQSRAHPRMTSRWQPLVADAVAAVYRFCATEGADPAPVAAANEAMTPLSEEIDQAWRKHGLDRWLAQIGDLLDSASHVCSTVDWLELCNWEGMERDSMWNLREQCFLALKASVSVSGVWRTFSTAPPPDLVAEMARDFVAAYQQFPDQAWTDGPPIDCSDRGPLGPLWKEPPSPPGHGGEWRPV